MRGTIRQRGKSWVLQVPLGRSPDGKRRYQTKTVTGTRKHAEAELARMVVEASDAFSTPSTDTVAGWLDQWLAMGRARNRWAPSTWRKHEGNARLYINPELGAVKLRDLSPVDVARLYGKLAGRLSSRSVLGVHRTLSQAFEDAIRLELVSRNPAQRVDKPTIPTGDQEAASDAQVVRLLALVADDPLWHAWFRLAAYTGARPGELAVLRWADVNLSAVEGALTLWDTAGLDYEGGRYVSRGRTKTKKSRTIALDPATVDVVVAWRDHQAGVADRAGARLEADSWVFPKWRIPHHPDAMPPIAGAKRWAQLRPYAGIPAHLSPYSLRHWHASWLLRNGVGLNVVAHRIGHAQPTMTANVYGRHVPAGDRSVAELIGRLELG